MNEEKNISDMLREICSHTDRRRFLKCVGGLSLMGGVLSADMLTSHATHARGTDTNLDQKKGFTITLDIYSGLPNPSWQIDTKTTSELVDRLQGYNLLGLDEMSGGLGYRGFIVTANDKQATQGKIPDKFSIGPSYLESARAAATSQTKSEDIALWLLQTNSGTLSDKQSAGIESEIRRLSRNRPTSSVVSEAQSTITPSSYCLLKNSAYNPDFWNNDSTTRQKNNCYNYAMNCKTNTFAQPGRQAGHMWTIATVSNIKAAAIADGNKENGYCSLSQWYKLVAMVVAPPGSPGMPKGDFHWYRLHSDGFWGHKPGQTMVRNRDNSNRIIQGLLNPSNCDRGPYTQFGGYLYSPLGILVL